MTTTLLSLFKYNAWANSDLFNKLQNSELQKHHSEQQKILKLISHYYVISRIFCGHLQGINHGFTSDNLDETPEMAELQSAVASSDQWFIDYVQTSTPASLAEPLAFIFTDGDKGGMTREEMLTHVALHAGYHRGEIGRILWQLSITPPWDTFAVYLHQSEPERREMDSRQH